MVNYFAQCERNRNSTGFGQFTHQLHHFLPSVDFSCFSFNWPILNIITGCSTSVTLRTTCYTSVWYPLTGWNHSPSLENSESVPIINYVIFNSGCPKSADWLWLFETRVDSSRLQIRAKVMKYIPALNVKILNIQFKYTISADGR